MIEKMSRIDLEMIILEEDELYYSLDEQMFLKGEYSTEELKNIIGEWIIAGDETHESCK